jgi:YD repeat-containing protein
MRTKPNFLSIMTITQLVPRMLLVMLLALTILVSAPSRVLSTDPVKTKGQQHTEAITDGKGNQIGIATITKEPGGGTTRTENLTRGPNAPSIRTYRVDRNGVQVSAIIHNADGSALTSVPDGKGGNILTLKDKEGDITTEKRDSTGKLVSKTIEIPDHQSVGHITIQTIDPTTGKVTVSKDTVPNGRVRTITYTASGQPALQTIVHPDGKVETTTYDPSGKPTGLTLNDSKGNVTTALPDGKGGFISTAKGEHGKVATSSYDADGKLTGETTKDKHGKVVSTTAVTPDGKGGTTSVTKDKHGKVVSTTTTGPDGKVVSQTGKKQKFSDAGAQTIGGTQTSQGSGKHKDKHKLQTQFFQQNKDKSNIQDSGSSGASSGSGQQKHHKKH